MSIDALANLIADQLLGQKTEPKSQLLWERLRQKGDPDWYAAYLRSHHWRRLRKLKLERGGYRCEKCGYADPYKDRVRGTRLHLHHLTYERLGHERLSDLQVLCFIDHRAAHA